MGVLCNVACEVVYCVGVYRVRNEPTGEPTDRYSAVDGALIGFSWVTDGLPAIDAAQLGIEVYYTVHMQYSARMVSIDASITM